MDSTIAGSMNDNINMDSTIAGSMNDNINMDSTIAGSMNVRMVDSRLLTKNVSSLLVHILCKKLVVKNYLIPQKDPFHKIIG